MSIHVNDPSFNKNLGKYQSHTFVMKFYRTPCHFSSNNTALPPTLPHMDHPPQYVYHTINGGHMQLQVVSNIPCGDAFLFPKPASNSIKSLHTPNSPTSPFEWCHHFLIDLMKWPQYGGCKSLLL